FPAEEPERPPTPQPKTTVFERGTHHKTAPETWSTIKITLVGSHPLWGHYLWNAARAFAKFLDENPRLYCGRNVLELGAGGGLPGLLAAKNGARQVLLTDYPDTNLLKNLEKNVADNDCGASTSVLVSLFYSHCSLPDHVCVQGYVWGHPMGPLLDHIHVSPADSNKYDLIILSDLVFNHSEHEALLKTCDLCLSTSVINLYNEAPCVLVFYTHHRPHLAQKDLQFFEKARNLGWICKEILQERFQPMFPDDPGDEKVRAVVHGWKLTRRLLV
ncbi:hypothetical protein FISHEDRAFT_51130, partial [Fistulina hepatica ATCC 64428]